MFKSIYICHNLSLYDEIQTLIKQIKEMYGDQVSVTDKLIIEDIAVKVNSDYRQFLQTRKNWKSLKLDNVLLSALRDELRRLKKIYALKVHKSAS